MKNNIKEPMSPRVGAAEGGLEEEEQLVLMTPKGKESLTNNKGPQI